MNKDTTTGTISVSRPLDFETRNMYRLQVVALDMYVEIGKDSRNAAAFEVIVVVEDVQDTPPIFTRLETIVHLHNNMSIVRPPPIVYAHTHTRTHIIYCILSVTYCNNNIIITTMVIIITIIKRLIIMCIEKKSNSISMFCT